ncbi:MAG: peroxiredoxin family protein [Flavobacteriaceae bacterium]
MEKRTIPSYKEGLKELRGQLKEMLPSNALSTFDNDAEQLGNTHTSILKLNEGDKAPDFSLVNAVGETVRLNDFLQKGKVVLTFYRGTWCPYCNLQLNQYQQILNKIKEKGASLIAISPQTPDSSLSIKETNQLEFEVLSDNGNIVARQFTKVFKNGGAPIQAMADLGYDYDEFYGDDSKEIPTPAVFIIDQDGIITFARAESGDYRKRVEPKEILNALNN